MRDILTDIDMLSARLTRHQEFLSAPGNRRLTKSAEQLVEASDACGQGVTLNAAQTRALWLLIDAAKAHREVRRLVERQTAEKATPTNITRVKF